MTVNTHPTPPHRNSMSAISQLLLTRFWPNFKSRFLNWFQLSWQHLSRQHLSISGISQLLLPRFWPNFKSRFLGPSWTVPTVMVTCVQATFVLATFVHNQEYLSCYWPNFDQTSKVDCWDHLEMIPTVMAPFVQAIFVHIRNISAVIDPILAKLFGL